MKAFRARSLLTPLVPVYAGAIAIKSKLFERGILPQRGLRHRVISVGSLSAGGAGKTPVVLMLAELLQQERFEIRILSRGYGRNGIGIEQVDPAGEAAHFGDEPLLMARRLPSASVYVATDRHRAGRLAERDDSAEVRAIYLLDDGFQHRKLSRNVDIVLLTRQDIEDTLLPAGDLREPLSALLRADVIVLREEESTLAEEVKERFAGSCPPIWLIRRRLRFADEAQPASRPLAFCGLARPESFFSMLATNGIFPVATVIFRDHHPYSSADIDRLIQAAKQQGANGFVTTEKDAVKFSPDMLRGLESIGPVVAPQLHVEFVDEQAGLETLRSLLVKKRKRTA